MLSGPLVISGIVRDVDGSPVADQTLYFVPWKRTDSGGAVAVEYLNAAPVHPGGKTDKDGQFAIQVPMSRITSRQEFTVALIKDGGAVSVIESHGAIRVFTVDDKTKRLNLGEVTLVQR